MTNGRTDGRLSMGILLARFVNLTVRPDGSCELIWVIRLHTQYFSAALITQLL